MFTILLSLVLHHAYLSQADGVDAFTPDCEGWPEQHRAGRAAKVGYRQRSWDTCKAMGADDEACDVIDAIALRESYGGDTCATHTLGINEHGLGMHGLSVGLHRPKWGLEGPDAVLQIPEVSTVVTMRIFRRAVSAYRAKRWRDVGNVFGGRFEFQDGPPTGDDFVFCQRLERAGVDCEASPRGKLGKVMGERFDPEQEGFVLALLRGG